MITMIKVSPEMTFLKKALQMQMWTTIIDFNIFVQIICEVFYQNEAHVEFFRKWDSLTIF